METVSWIDSSGVETVLDGDDFFIAQGIDGRGLPPIDLLTDDAPLIDGSILRGTKVKSRSLAVPLVVVGSGRNAVRQRIRALASKFAPVSDSDSFLVIKYEDGTTRKIGCRYSGGMEIEESGASALTTFQSFVAQFTAPSPYWEGDIVSQLWLPGAATAFFGNPWFPLHISPSSIQGDTTIENEGEVATFPVWTLGGPAQGVLITNMVTGEFIELSGNVADGDTIVIDTRPGKKSAVSSINGNIFHLISTDSTFWKLPIGNTRVTFGAIGTDAGSFIRLDYYPLYWTA